MKMDELRKIEDLLFNLQKLQPLNQQSKTTLEKKLRLEFNYNTNHIEGNTITYSETELLLIFDDSKGNHTLRELEEMKGSDVAFQLIQELAADAERPLSEQNIKYLNQILLVRPFWKDAVTEDGQNTRRLIKVGEYKEFPNSVRLQNGEIFHYASPIETPALMSELINWYRTEEEKKELSPIILAALLHYKFVRIHPFDDGNGRISRLLMNYVLFKNNLPPIIIKSIEKKNYLAALNSADSGDMESFTKFIAQQLIWSIELSLKAAKGESLDEPGDLDKKIRLLKQKLFSAEESVKITKSSATLLKNVNEILEPLLNQISKKLGEFDSLFKSKNEYLSTGTHRIGSNLHSCLINMKNHLKTNSYDDIQYNYSLIDFRKGEKQFNVSCSFNIEFHINVYEFKSPDNTFKISKLYHETLADTEIIEIVENLGTDIINKIENNM